MSTHQAQFGLSRRPTERPRPARAARRRRWLWLVAVVLAVLAAIMLLWFQPRTCRRETTAADTRHAGVTDAHRLSASPSAPRWSSEKPTDGRA
jgi:ferric-dicitrate binding protein FerR (iron transport regulator)